MPDFQGPAGAVRLGIDCGDIDAGRRRLAPAGARRPPPLCGVRVRHSRPRGPVRYACRGRTRAGARHSQSGFRGRRAAGTPAARPGGGRPRRRNPRGTGTAWRCIACRGGTRHQSRLQCPHHRHGRSALLRHRCAPMRHRPHHRRGGGGTWCGRVVLCRLACLGCNRGDPRAPAGRGDAAITQPGTQHSSAPSISVWSKRSPRAWRGPVPPARRPPRSPWRRHSILSSTASSTTWTASTRPASTR